MGIETLMAKEAMGLLIRRPDKRSNVIGQYLISFVDYEVSRTGRAAYFFIRYMDDLLDGDRKLRGEVDTLAHIASIRSQVESGDFTGKPKIMRLAEYSLDALQKKTQPGDNPRQDFLDVIDIMVFDHHRIGKRQALTTAELNDYYLRVNSPVHNLMLIGLESGLRVRDIVEFPLYQGRINTLEHLQADWKAGIINVPEEILKSAELSPQSSYEEVTESSVVKIWAENELRESKTALFSVQTRFPLSENLTRMIYNGLTRSMLKFIDKYSSGR